MDNNGNSISQENEKFKSEFKNVHKLYDEYMNTEQLSAASFIYEIGEILSRVGIDNEQTQ